MSIPQYLIDQAKWRVLDVWKEDNTEKYQKRIDKWREQIKDDIKEYRLAQRRLRDALYLRGELIEWLQSIGEYEEPKQINFDPAEQTTS